MSAEKLEVWPMALVVGEKTISGSKIGNRAAVQEMLEFVARHGVKAQVEVMPLAEVNAALDRVRQNRARYRMVLATG
jgi:D-arabinose 1-dehydrogenase-like Zn-dependent alcohol dehydrogenase